MSKDVAFNVNEDLKTLMDVKDVAMHRFLTTSFRGTYP